MGAGAHKKSWATQRPPPKGDSWPQPGPKDSNASWELGVICWGRASRCQRRGISWQVAGTLCVNICPHDVPRPGRCNPQQRYVQVSLSLSPSRSLSQPLPAATSPCLWKFLLELILACGGKLVHGLVRSSLQPCLGNGPVSPFCDLPC